MLDGIAESWRIARGNLFKVVFSHKRMTDISNSTLSLTKFV